MIDITINNSIKLNVFFLVSGLLFRKKDGTEIPGLVFCLLLSFMRLPFIKTQFLFFSPAHRQMEFRISSVGMV
jgi:hypothetical protein